MIYIVGFLVLAFFAWVVYELQDKIGRQQAREWREYVLAHPELFKQNEPKSDIRQECNVKGNNPGSASV